MAGRIAVAEGRPTISTHVLDLELGTPAAGVAVDLSRIGADGSVLDLALGRTTDRDGRVADLLGDVDLAAGIYEIRFDVAAHDIDKKRRPRFFWTVALHFEVTDTSRSYHVPLLLSPYGLATYRGS